MQFNEIENNNPSTTTMEMKPDALVFISIVRKLGIISLPRTHNPKSPVRNFLNGMKAASQCCQVPTLEFLFLTSAAAIE